MDDDYALRALLNVLELGRFQGSPRCLALDAFHRMHRHHVIVIVPRNFYTHPPRAARSPLERNSCCARLVIREIFLNRNTHPHDIQHLFDGDTIVSGCSHCMTWETEQSSLERFSDRHDLERGRQHGRKIEPIGQHCLHAFYDTATQTPQRFRALGRCLLSVSARGGGFLCWVDCAPRR